MFTGIVLGMGTVGGLTRTGSGRSLFIHLHPWTGRGVRFSRGDSICVAGVCLTIVTCNAKHFTFDVVPETLAKTTLGSLKVGDLVNLEPSLNASGFLGGHIVQGHVDGRATVKRINKAGGQHRLTIQLPASLRNYAIPKGSITIDGVSLTIASASGRGAVDIALIPTTLELTTLSRLSRGDAVNVEMDILIKTIVQVVKQMQRSRR